jgi:hypothetical protein
MEVRFLIKRQVERTVRNGEEPSVTHAPLFELRADRFDQAFANAGALAIGTQRQWSEKPDAAPSGHEVGADQFAV